MAAPSCADDAAKIGLISNTSGANATNEPTVAQIRIAVRRIPLAAQSMKLQMYIQVNLWPLACEYDPGMIDLDPSGDLQRSQRRSGAARLKPSGARESVRGERTAR